MNSPLLRFVVIPWMIVTSFLGAYEAVGSWRATVYYPSPMLFNVATMTLVIGLLLQSISAVGLWHGKQWEVWLLFIALLLCVWPAVWFVRLLGSVTAVAIGVIQPLIVILVVRALKAASNAPKP